MHSEFGMRIHRRRLTQALTLLACFAAAGCQDTVGARKFGKTYYLDGAGHWGWSAPNVIRGLHEAGYPGHVEVFRWSTSYNPLIDHVNTPAARARAAELARRIEDDHRRYPRNPINIIALSAGTGVAVWAVEDLRGGARVHNMVFLASSLSHDYDVSEALANMTGRIYVYSSPNDAILDRLPLLGTVDGKRGVEAAGLIGLKPPPGYLNRVVNISWSPQWVQYGWRGGHLDITNPFFIRAEIARHVVPSSALAARTGSDEDVSVRPHPETSWRQHDFPVHHSTVRREKSR